MSHKFNGIGVDASLLVQTPALTYTP